MLKEATTNVMTNEMTTSITFIRKRLAQTIEQIQSDQKIVEQRLEQRPSDTFTRNNRYKHKSLVQIGANLYQRFYKLEELLRTIHPALSTELHYYELMQEMALFNEMRFQVKKGAFPLFSTTHSTATIRHLAVA